MSEQLQLRHNTYAQVQTFTGAQAECVVDTSNNRIVLNDGSTAGGWPAAKLAEVTPRPRHDFGRGLYGRSRLRTGASLGHLIAYTALTAPRMVSLAGGGVISDRNPLPIVDEAGRARPRSRFRSPAGTDKINGVEFPGRAQPVRLWVDTLESNGSNAWVIVELLRTDEPSTLAQSVNGAPMKVGHHSR